MAVAVDVTVREGVTPTRGGVGVTVSRAAGEGVAEGVGDETRRVGVIVACVGEGVNIVGVIVAVGVAVSVGSVTTGGGAHARLLMATATARASTRARTTRLRITRHELVTVIVARVGDRGHIPSGHNRADEG